MGWLFPIHGQIQNVPNHQSEWCLNDVYKAATHYDISPGGRFAAPAPLWGRRTTRGSLPRFEVACETSMKRFGRDEQLQVITKIWWQPSWNSRNIIMMFHSGIFNNMIHISFCCINRCHHQGIFNGKQNICIYHLNWTILIFWVHIIWGKKHLLWYRYFWLKNNISNHVNGWHLKITHIWQI